MTKKTVLTISQYNYDRLKEIGGSTMEEKIKTLFQIIAPFMPVVEYTEKNKSIKVEPSTRDYVDAFRISLGESRDTIITRAFLILDELNNTASVEEWIPFKITNKYNNLLVIDGQLEYNSKELSFNYRGNLYRGKLPSNYIVNGKNLTKELYIWYDDLDWNKITNYLIENVDEQTIVEENSFILEINDVLKQN